jgi:hypothetical protein
VAQPSVRVYRRFLQLVQIAGDPAKTRNLGNIYVRLTPLEDRKRDQFGVMDRFGDVLPDGQPADIGAAHRQHRRRRRQNADIQFIVSGLTSCARRLQQAVVRG